jgi:hypothetical protein
MKLAFGRLASLAVLGVLWSCGNRQGSAWEQPWDCHRLGVSGRYECTDMSVTWREWMSENKSQPRIAYRCVTQGFDPEFDPYDFICKPVPSRAANRFEDGTMPRFHCFGTYDDTDSTTQQFGCVPYWEVPSDVRQREGSGWFLWLALQEQGKWRDGFMAVAERMAAAEEKELLQLKPMAPTPPVTVGPDSLKKLDEATSALIAEAVAREKARASMSAEAIQREVARFEDAWESGQLIPPRSP